ncbi:hypothetical protein IRP63_15540 (plasmid) [Clostridium botulinum]|uniref:Uncharacterized protein n=1 Tax=Clostridium botulinum C/D str. DC5 TaxID=1443128 RepID=A0A0A0HWV6_CLOBO|nr:hypothetical protein [Clostridium botulinum]KGM93037.1 hypothetical protein Z955_16030 [Clostridium botulinum C/D str. DC5]KOC50600.1 hypothetical protein ADU89_14480 [Clostridium botulinum]KOC56031.1 hypothetical protein ADU90_09230 [Clostridium botulinum]MCD3235446.1 hypothetical protein [Clostridium botulinum D/C]MCD3241384.1 hypothetical protein [Clostridium botulinum D/C]
MNSKKKLALLITTTMLVASPLYGCRKPFSDYKNNPINEEKEEEEKNSHSGHINPGFFNNRNSNFNNGGSGGSSGKSWGTSGNGGSYSNGHGGSAIS